MPCLAARKDAIGEPGDAGTARRRASSCGRCPLFLYHRKLLRMDLAVLPRLVARKATIGEHKEAGTARFFCAV